MSATQTLTTKAEDPGIVSHYKDAASMKYGDWRDDFYKNGYAVIKNAITPEKAKSYQDRALDWVQSFDLGLDLKDSTTWTEAHLPKSFKNMYHYYCAGHEKFLWDARTEPGILKIYEDLWGTKELVVSFDGFNIGLPKRTDIQKMPWPHCDQAPTRKGLACAQGFLNLAPSGPKDGGLMLMEGSAPLFEEFFSEPREMFRPPGGRGPPKDFVDLFLFKQEHLDWFRERGCELMQVDCGPGDFVIWDSRTMHYASFPEGEEIRTVFYICYTPRAFGTQEDMDLKARLFETYRGTTHWPHCNIRASERSMVDGKVDPMERDEPLEKPERTDLVLKLAAVKAW
ncbi:phytanoyl-CoA dioxygenase [Mollisia scopiformis]|uniref:Phytanoyl-CoA dioxygenase n=1 Tax=Mollisia scopiformis TaxID=149040 RepID=A0A194X4D9_MOLSC|nr:phytanoyl-CoA dioxygenase [Mollisia scopiformis]KUJ15036.1 phytanoyl-CoA dioxygenase [Mollisia scopiformis]